MQNAFDIFMWCHDIETPLFDYFYVVDKLLNKKSSWWWLGTPRRACGVTVMIYQLFIDLPNKALSRVGFPLWYPRPSFLNTWHSDRSLAAALSVALTASGWACKQCGWWRWTRARHRLGWDDAVTTISSKHIISPYSQWKISRLIE